MPFNYPKKDLKKYYLKFDNRQLFGKVSFVEELIKDSCCRERQRESFFAI